MGIFILEKNINFLLIYVLIEAPERNVCFYMNKRNVMKVLLFCFIFMGIVCLSSKNVVEASDKINNLYDAIILSSNEFKNEKMCLIEEKDIYDEQFIEGLMIQYDYYVDELEDSNEIELEEIYAKLNKIEEIISVYYELNNLKTENYELDSSNKTYTFGISPNCTCDWTNYLLGEPCYNCKCYCDSLMAVSDIASMFSLRGWKLAADLMLHNISNSVLDSDYTPKDSLLENLKNSPQIKNDIAIREELTMAYHAAPPGNYNGLFENTAEGDVYNALGSFYYAKSYVDTNFVKISILDRYDWEKKDYNGIGTELNNILVTAQEIGVVTPFYTKIDIKVEGNASLSWEYYDDGVQITGCSSNVNSINLSIDWYDLRDRSLKLPIVKTISIEPFAFYNCSQLTSVSIPNTVTKIGSYAFSNCKSISSINIPLSVTFIGQYAFENCESLSIYTENLTKPIYWDDNWNGSNCPVIWGGRNRTLITDSLSIDDYCFPSEYNDFNAISKEVISNGGYKINTNRLRCGVICYDGKSYLTLSAKNRNATTAYIEYFYPKPLIQIQYQLALWSSSESLVLNSSIRLEALYDGEWTLCKSFNANDLSQNKDNLMDYSIVLSSPTTAFRFIVDTNQVSNNNNRGRLVIGKIDAIMVSSHIHKYKVSPYSQTQHVYVCSCGDFYYGPHVIETYIGDRREYGNCCICGELVDLGKITGIRPYTISEISDDNICFFIDDKKYYSSKQEDYLKE